MHKGSDLFNIAQNEVIRKARECLVYDANYGVMPCEKM